MSIVNSLTTGGGVVAAGCVSDGTHTLIVCNARGGKMAATGATGVYAFTLDEALNTLDACVLTSLRANSGIIQCAHTSDTVKTFSTFAVDGTTATDKNFDFLILRVSP